MANLPLAPAEPRPAPSVRLGGGAPHLRLRGTVIDGVLVDCAQVPQDSIWA